MAQIVLLLLYKIMWITRFTPIKWIQGLITLIYKKGDIHDITNYRPITLLNSLFKLWEKILDTRARTIIQDKYPLHLQMGSQKGNSSSWTILASNILIDKALEEGKPIYIASIDMNKAYNRVNRNKLWAILESMGITGNLLLNIMNTYKNAKEIIIIGNIKSKALIPTHQRTQTRINLITPTIHPIHKQPNTKTTRNKHRPKFHKPTEYQG